MTSPQKPPLRQSWSSSGTKRVPHTRRSQTASLVDQGNRRVGSTDRERRGRLVVIRTRRRSAPAPKLVARTVAGQAARMVHHVDSGAPSAPSHLHRRNPHRRRFPHSGPVGRRWRHVRLLSDEALGGLCKLLHAAEASDDMLCAQRSVMVCVLSKPTGGFRPIGLPGLGQGTSASCSGAAKQQGRASCILGSHCRTAVETIGRQAVSAKHSGHSLSNFGSGVGLLLYPHGISHPVFPCLGNVAACAFATAERWALPSLSLAPLDCVSACAFGGVR